MKIIDAVVYSDDENVNLKVIEVKILSDLCLLIEFSNGEKRIFDANQLLKYPVYEKLRDDKIFSGVSIENGVITWDNGMIDVSSEFLYENSQSYMKN